MFRPGASIDPTAIQNSDVAVNRFFTDFDFLKLNSDSVASIGFTDSNDGYQTYSNPVKKLQYPCTYNSIFLDNFSGHTQSMAIGWSMFGNILVKADSYGTLILPSGVVNNVLRVKSIKVSYERSGIDSTLTLDWYLPGVHVPVFTVSKQIATYSNFTLINYPKGYYINPLALSIVEETKTHFAFQTFPNPASSETTIQYELKTASTVRLVLTDVLGKETEISKQTTKAAGSYSENLQVSHLPKGIYFLRLETEVKVAVKRLLVQ